MTVSSTKFFTKMRKNFLILFDIGKRIRYNIKCEKLIYKWREAP